MASELEMLAHRLGRLRIKIAAPAISATTPSATPSPRPSPVSPSIAPISPAPLCTRWIAAASILPSCCAIDRNPHADADVFSFLRETAAALPDSFHRCPPRRATHLRRQIQQLTAPVTAKGVEDTAFYIFNRLASLNEWRRPRPLRNPAGRAAQLSRQSPEDLAPRPSATSTHDTKCSEDVRPCLNVLSEIPQEWQSALTRWTQLTARPLIPTPVPKNPDEPDSPARGLAAQRPPEAQPLARLLLIHVGRSSSTFNVRLGISTQQEITPNEQYLLYQLLAPGPSIPVHPSTMPISSNAFRPTCSRRCAKPR